MDVLLSLPIASYFFSSAATSWSTTLNLLFFYMTWSTLILSHSPLQIELIGTIFLRLILWLLPSVIFLLFDALLPSLAESIKHGGPSALPPRDSATLTRLALLALFNLALETIAQAAVSASLATLFQRSGVFHTSATLPLPFQMLKHIALMFAAREIMTYYIHRFVLHNRGRGRGRSHMTVIASTLHGQYAHARAAPPYSLLLRADHPLPFLLHRFVPLYLPALLLSSHLHLLTFFLFVALCTAEETLATSGYTTVPGILTNGIARRTAIHYVCLTGNFGCLGVLDWINDTSLGRDVMDDVRREAEKHRVRERSSEAAYNASGVVQSSLGGLRRSARQQKAKKVI